MMGGRGAHAVAVTALGAVAACLAGCADLPARAVVGPFATSPLERRADRDLPADVEPLALRATDGVALRGYLLTARGGRSRGVMVFLHGLGGSALDWIDAARQIARAGFDAVAWDGRGHGRSGGLCTWGAREPGDLEVVLAALAARRLPVDRTVLFGYSMGAVVALADAAHAAAASATHTTAARIRAVVAVAPLASLESALTHAARSAPRSSIVRALAAIERDAHFDPAALRSATAASLITIPLLVVAGANDRLALPADAAAIARAARDARLVLVEAADHATVLSRCGPPCDTALANLLHQAGF